MKRFLIFLITLISAFSFSACWSKKEPKNLALINTVLYDLSDTGFKVTLEIRNPSASATLMGGGSGGKNPSMTASGEGPSIVEAIRNVSRTLERTLDSGHNKVRYFSKKFAEKDIYGVMDFVFREHITDESPYIVVVKNNDAGLVYKAKYGLADVSGDYIENIYKEEPASASKAVFVSTLDFVKQIYMQGRQPVAGLVEIVENKDKPSNNSGSGSSQQGTPEPEYKMVYAGLAAFKGNKLIGFFNDTEARAYNLVTNNFDETHLSVKLNEDIISVSAGNGKCKIKAKKENGKITFDIGIKIRGIITENNGTADLTQKDTIKEIENLINMQIETQVSDAVKKAQTEFKSDIFGLGDKIHDQMPNDWKSMKENWDDEFFPAAEIKIKVECDIPRIGQIAKSIKSSED